MYGFARGMIAFRRAHPILSTEQFYTDADIHWFDFTEDRPTDGSEEQQLACLIHAASTRRYF
jgi:glycogen operon protein